MDRTARSRSAGFIPPGSGVPVPGAKPGSSTSMSTDRYSQSQPSPARAMASAITGRIPRSHTSCIRCQVISCSRIQSKTSGGGQ